MEGGRKTQVTEEREVERDGWREKENKQKQTDGEREIDTKRDGGRMRAVERMIKGKVCWRERERK